jgi:myo-inositol-1(or 4)-monophosphatase
MMKHLPLYEDLLSLMRQAGEIIRSAHDKNVNESITEKSGTANFVTTFDVRVQEFLIHGIQSLLPDAVFIAEEKENDITEMTAEHCFIIDPIDGTTNFICDFHHSAISLALLSRGEAVFGAVYHPYFDEMFSAERGKGAFCNGHPIHVSNRPIERALVMFGTSPYSKEAFGNCTFELCKKFFLPCNGITFGSDFGIGRYVIVLVNFAHQIF